MYQYKRIMDIKEATFDSLETLCTREGVDGWRVIAISDGSLHRYATLEKQIDPATITTKQDSERSGLPIDGPTSASGYARVKRGARDNSQGTKG